MHLIQRNEMYHCLHSLGMFYCKHVHVQSLSEMLHLYLLSVRTASGQEGLVLVLKTWWREQQRQSFVSAAHMWLCEATLSYRPLSVVQ